MSTAVIISFRIPVHVFLAVHPIGQCLCHLVSVIVEILTVHGLTDIDPDLSSVESVKRMRVLGSPRPDLISACDINGNERDVCLDGEIGSAVFHFGELTCVSPGSFREYEADIALFDFLLCLDESSNGIAVTVNGDAASNPHYEAAQFAVIGLKIGGCQAAHPLEMALRQIVDDEDAVRITLVV